MIYPTGFSGLFVERLNSILNAYTYAWFSYIAIKDDEVSKVIAGKGSLLIDGSFKLELADVIKIAREDPAKSSIDFMFFVLRAAIISFYEAFKGDADRYQCVMSESWFLLLASLRQSVSHGIEGEWRSIKTVNGDSSFIYMRVNDGVELVFSKNMIGQPINLEMATYIDIFQQAISFSKSKCSMPKTACACSG